MKEPTFHERVAAIRVAGESLYQAELRRTARERGVALAGISAITLMRQTSHALEQSEPVLSAQLRCAAFELQAALEGRRQ